MPHVRHSQPAGYVDPAASMTLDSYKHTCSVNGNNGAHNSSSTWVATPELESAADMKKWVMTYTAATSTKNVSLSKLWELSNRKKVYALNPDRNQSFFDFINLKMHVLDALERRLPDRHNLWKPGTTMLDIGCGHGFLAGYLQVRHQVFIKGYDIANSYQCREIMVRPGSVRRDVAQ